MYGGSSKTDLGGLGMTVDRDAANFSGNLYMYGDEGHDEMWGSNLFENEYFFGGEGDDTVYPGKNVQNSIIANGDEGDDTLYSSIANDFELVSEVLRGGKGDDWINPIELAFDANGDVDVANTEWVVDPSNSIPFNYGTATRRYYGGEGDDEIWGPSES